MPDFQIRTQKLRDEIVAVIVKGFLDALTFEQMEKTIDELFSQNIYQLVVDLTDLDYISSAGAGVFIGAVGTAQENNGNIVLVNPSHNVKEVFDLLGLSQIFPFADDLESAAQVFE